MDNVYTTSWHIEHSKHIESGVCKQARIQEFVRGGGGPKIWKAFYLFIFFYFFFAFHILRGGGGNSENYIFD